jgi:hypothetical protein
VNPEIAKEEVVMTAEKKPDQSPKRATAATGGRKPWTPRSPVEVVLDQIEKQQTKVANLEQELETEKAMLNKLLQAKKLLEST